MDLSRLDTMSRAELEVEARRVGVWAPERRSRDELIRRVRDHHADSVTRAGRTLVRAFRFARKLIRGESNIPLPRASIFVAEDERVADEPVAEEPVAEAPVNADEVGVDAASGAASGPETGAEDAAESEASEPEAAESEAAEPEASESEASESEASESEASESEASESEASEPEASESEASEPQASEPGDLGVGEELEALLAKEPIQTRSMARLLRKQRFYRRALAIYQRLALERPDDGGVLDELRQTQREFRAHTSGESSSADDDESDGVRAIPLSERRAMIVWNLSSAGWERAREALESGSALEARVVVVEPSGEGPVRRTLRREVALRGEWLVDDLPGRARLTAAIGLLKGERFVAICHAPVVTCG